LGSLHDALVERSGAMRRRISKNAPECTNGAAFWIILRDTALRAALRMQSGPASKANSLRMLE
jgi:hypothetical protein